jgi:hypothetical protein
VIASDLPARNDDTEFVQCLFSLPRIVSICQHLSAQVSQLAGELYSMPSSVAFRLSVGTFPALLECLKFRHEFLIQNQ